MEIETGMKNRIGKWRLCLGLVYIPGFIVWSLSVALGAGLLIFVVLPMLLAAIAAILQAFSKRQNEDKNLKFTSLYTGRVWHTRFHPNRHAFQYPIFMFAMDLAELDGFRAKLWPLVPYLVNFRPHQDHLKNGEGMTTTKSKETSSALQTSHNINADDHSDHSDSNRLMDRVFRLVAERTNDKFIPSTSTHRVVLLTHLCYYGYNFNPVSFYYIVDRKNEVVDAMVGEVSNTPWLEMYCYVLQKDSNDQVQVVKSTQSGSNDPAVASSSSSTSQSKQQYSFPKTFHVSPFMEMDYWYDWTFVGVPQLPTPPTTTVQQQPQQSSEITVVNTLRRRGNDQVVFTAKLVMDARPMTPLQVAWQMIRFPTFCFLIQLWIHYQAAWLFIKGIVYVPHPQGCETAASKAIATIMVPFFAVRDYFYSQHSKSKTE
jgi:uncharacterized protein